MKNQYFRKMMTSIMLSFIFINATSNIVITEIMYNPPESGSDSIEYIELFNNSDQAIDMEGYYFSSGVTYTFPQIIFEAQSYLTISVDSQAVKNTFGVSTLEWTSGGLSNGGEPIALKDTNNNTIDSLRYDDVIAWSTAPDGGGYSLVLVDINKDNTNGANWKASCTPTGKVVNGYEIYGSPNAANACICANIETRTNGDTIFSQATNANYQWLDVNNNYSPIPDETNAQFIATNTGVYAVQVTQDGCTDTSDSVHIIITSISKHKNPVIKAFPNPSKGLVNIALEKEYQQVEVRVLDLSGRQLMVKNFDNTQQVTFMLEQKQGTYLLEIKADEELHTQLLQKE